MREQKERGKERGRDSEEKHNNHNCDKTQAFWGPIQPSTLLLQAIYTPSGQSPLSFFLIVAVTIYHKGDDLKQHKLIILWFWRSEV